MTTTIPKDDIVVAPAKRAPLRLGLPHAIIAGLVVAAFIIPLFASSFVTFQLTEVLIYGLAILGLNLLTGFNGQFSLGHSAFYGIGAYTAAILIHNYEVSYLWTIPAAGGVCFVIGFLFGLPALRLQTSIWHWQPSRWRRRCRKSSSSTRWRAGPAGSKDWSSINPRRQAICR